MKFWGLGILLVPLAIATVVEEVSNVLVQDADHVGGPFAKESSLEKVGESSTLTLDVSKAVGVSSSSPSLLNSDEKSGTIHDSSLTLSQSSSFLTSELTLSSLLSDSIGHYVDMKKASDLRDPRFPLASFFPKEQPQEGSEPLPILFSLRLLRLIDVDEAEQTFKIVAELNLSWRDHRLAVPDNMQFIVLDPESVWTPSVNANNLVKEAVTSEEVRLMRHSATVTKVHYKRRFTATLFTQMSFDNFPFDQQSLGLAFAIAGKTESSVKFLLFPVNTPLTDNVATKYNGTWSFLVSKQTVQQVWDVTSSDVQIQSPSETGEATVVLSIGIKRYHVHYFYRYIIPMIFIEVASLVTFSIDLKQITSRVGLSSVAFISSLLISITFTAERPSLGYLTNLDIVILFHIFITLLVLPAVVMIHDQCRREAAEAEEAASQPLLVQKQPDNKSERINSSTRNLFALIYTVIIITFFATFSN